MPRNPYLCLAIVCALASVVLVGAVGYIILALNGREIPSAMIALVSACVGALSSFLVSVPQLGTGALFPHHEQRHDHTQLPPK